MFLFLATAQVGDKNYLDEGVHIFVEDRRGDDLLLYDYEALSRWAVRLHRPFVHNLHTMD